jgi:hypothetical protein
MIPLIIGVFVGYLCHGQFHHVWSGDDFSKKPYVANGLNIVNVQIVGS